MVPIKIDIPKDFLVEEIRCDYTISQQMKEVWAICLDLLEEFKRVCKKHQLHYIADFGTLLGAIRHKGFIPWDDDIDVSMPRADYEKLLQIAPTEFTHPYYLETFYTDPHFCYGKAKLLNLNTTGYENIFIKRHALFIDIFPLDGVIENEKLLKEQGRRMHKYFGKTLRVVTCSHRWYYQEKGISLPRRMVRLYEYYKMKLFNITIGGDYHRKMYKKFEEESMRYNIGTRLIGDVVGYQADAADKLDIQCVYDAKEVEFEFTKISIPSNSQVVLTQMYGDYLKFVKGNAYHTFKIIDTNRPYTEVLRGNGILYE